MIALRIGVVSDTHSRAGGRPLPTALLAGLEAVDIILHAGDIACRAVLDSLAAIAPVYAVHGNIDPPELHDDLPDRQVIACGGVRIGLTHGHLGRGSTTAGRAVAQFLDTADLDMIVFGHSHVPLHEVRDGILLFNPGSPTQPRRQPLPTYGVARVEGGLLSASIVAFDP